MFRIIDIIVYGIWLINIETICISYMNHEYITLTQLSLLYLIYYRTPDFKWIYYNRRQYYYETMNYYKLKKI